MNLGDNWEEMRECMHGNTNGNNMLENPLLYARLSL